jgi:hypothetical protein
MATRMIWKGLQEYTHMERKQIIPRQNLVIESYHRLSDLVVKGGECTFIHSPHRSKVTSLAIW